MKTLKTTLLFLFASIAIIACNPQAAQAPPVKEFTVGGVTYDISKAVIFHRSSNKKTLGFLEAGLSFSTGNGGGVSGNGSFVYFTISDASILGTFNYGSNNAQGTFDDSGCTIEWDSVTETELSTVEINSGTITIQPYGTSGYSVVINDPAVSMTFEGDLEVGVW